MVKKNANLMWQHNAKHVRILEVGDRWKCTDGGGGGGGGG